jgi:hypothetical protein
VEILHASFSIAGPLITLIGVIVSVLGTYLLTKWYHPYTEHGFIDHLLEAPLLAMIILQKEKPPTPGEEAQPSSPQEKKAERMLKKLDGIAKVAEYNKERRSVSLVGVDLIFIGFVLQGVGAVCSLIDMIWLHSKGTM